MNYNILGDGFISRDALQELYQNILGDALISGDDLQELYQNILGDALQEIVLNILGDALISGDALRRAGGAGRSGAERAGERTGGWRAGGRAGGRTSGRAKLMPHQALVHFCYLFMYNQVRDSLMSEVICNLNVLNGL